MSIKLIAILISSGVFLFVVELVRRRRLTFKYALGWLVASLAAVFFSIFEKYLFEFSRWLGFELPSNFIFFTMFCLIVFLSLLLTVFLCQQNSRNDKMVQKLALLEFELKQLKEKPLPQSQPKQNQ